MGGPLVWRRPSRSTAKGRRSGIVFDMLVDSFSRDFTPHVRCAHRRRGATGALVALRMAAHGLTVAVLEAGPRFSGHTALQNAEANAGKIMWSEPRNFVGSDFVIPKAGTGVGGGTLPWLGVMPRFHRDDFRTLSTEGVGADWPIGYDDLRPHYEKVEREFGVAGECGPFAPEPYTLPMPPHRMNWHAQVLARGARKLGAHPFAPPIAINSVERDGRPACIYCGWCGSGCPTEAKATAANTYLAKAERLGARVISEAFVHRVNYDGAKNRVTGVEYLDRATPRASHRGESRRAGRPCDRDTAAAAAFRERDVPRRPRQFQRAGREELHEPSDVAGLRHVRRAGECVQGHADGPRHGAGLLPPDPRNGYARGFILLCYMMTPITFANLSG